MAELSALPLVTIFRTYGVPPQLDQVKVINYDKFSDPCVKGERTFSTGFASFSRRKPKSLDECLQMGPDQTTKDERCPQVKV